MIKLHWRLMDALKKYNETCTEESSSDVKVELGQKVIDLLNEEINNRRTNEKEVIISFLETFINKNFNIISFGMVNSVPCHIETQSIIDMKKFIKDFEFFTACNKVISYLKEEEN